MFIWGTGFRNPIASLLMLLMIVGLLVMVFGFDRPWPMFIFCFWFPMAFSWGGWRSGQEAEEKRKRKNDEYYGKAKNDETRTIITEDGEELEVVDEPRRDVDAPLYDELR